MPGRIPHENSRDAVDEFGRNKLHYAANNGDSITVKSLIDQGVDIDVQDNNAWAALHFASQNNHFDTIALLLENNANPNVHDNQGNGPLWTAAMNANGKCQGVSLLLKAQANPEHKKIIMDVHHIILQLF